MRYPVVLFDVGDTLIGARHSYGAVYADTLAELGVELEVGRLDVGIRLAAEDLRRRIPAGVDRFAFFPGGEREYWLRFARQAIAAAADRGIAEELAPRAVEPLWNAFREASVWRVYDDVLPVLRALRESGCRMGVGSNWDSRLPELLERLELQSFFDVIGVSHLEGVEKPAPAFFHQVLERLDAEPAQAIHVGDRPDADLAGAEAAGLDALLVQRNGRTDPTRPIARDLTSLPRLVR